MSLRKGEFRFGLQRGVVQRRKGKKPRPIVVSPITNRIVQRAILETLQSEAPSIRRRLGNIPEALRTRTSVGGIPGKGASDAVQLISTAISAGATHYVRSDIRDFFTKVPTASLIRSIREQTGDDEFVNLIQAGLKVELENASDPMVSEWLDLFPGGEIGVPQGSSLSAFCANYVLRKFDVSLNGPTLTTVRYIDDFVILGHSEAAVRDAWIHARKFLTELGLQPHVPTPGGTKASEGLVSDGFDFLSFRFRQGQIGLSRDVKKRLLRDVEAEIRAAKHFIQTSWSTPRTTEPRFAQALTRLDRKICGWGNSFRDVDQRVEFAQLDGKIFARIQAFIRWYTSRAREHQGKDKMRGLGVALLGDTPRRHKV